ncbi:MAG: hypothetical protein M0P31_10165 [Solirubrobacteraceae bacterium]|nr:hypothetical protein [Solirubrobacteraceae bacterium]
MRVVLRRSTVVALLAAASTLAACGSDDEPTTTTAGTATTGTTTVTVTTTVTTTGPSPGPAGGPLNGRALSRAVVDVCRAEVDRRDADGRRKFLEVLLEDDDLDSVKQAARYERDAIDRMRAALGALEFADAADRDALLSALDERQKDWDARIALLDREGEKYVTGEQRDAVRLLNATGRQNHAGAWSAALERIIEPPGDRDCGTAVP